MELLQLQYFLKVAETEHISQAARELYISQSTLSRSILRLEDGLGVKLFDRIGRNIRLNENGRRYLTHIKRVFWELEEGQRELERIQTDQQQPVLILSTIPGILDDLPELFRSPGQRMVKQQFIRRELLPTLMLSLHADFAVSEFPCTSQELEAQNLFEDELYLVLSRTHPLAEKNTLSLKELEQENAFVPPKGAGLREIADRLFETCGMSLRILSDEMTTTITDRSITRAAAGDGVVYISKYALYRFLKDQPDAWTPWYRQVKVVQIREENCRWYIGLTKLKRRQLSDLSQQLYQYVFQAFQHINQEMNWMIDAFFQQNQ